MCAHSDESELYQTICEVSVKFGEFPLAWIGLLDEASGEIRPTAAHGLEIEHWPFPPVNIHTGEMKNGLLAIALRSSRVVTSEDMQTDQRLAERAKLFQKYGYRSSAAVPFRLRGQTIGFLNLVSQEVGFFEAEEELRLLEEMSLDISFALDTMARERERRYAEEQVRVNKAKLEAALASMTDAVFISDTEGNFIDFNEAFATFHKFRNKSECAKTLAEYPEFLEVYLPDGGLATLEQWAVPRALRGETATNAEYSLRRKDTGESWVGSYSFAPIRDQEGTIVGSVVVGRDITDRKHAEKELLESEEKFRTLIEQSSEGISLVSEEGNILEWNRAMEEISGIPRAAAVGQPIWDIQLQILPSERRSPQSAETIKAFFTEVLQTGKLPLEKRYDVKIQTARGEHKIVTQTTFVIPTAAGYRVGSIVLDITERKQAEVKLQKSEEKYRSIFDGVQDAIFVEDLDGKIIDVNRRACEIFGYTHDEFITKNVMDIVPSSKYMVLIPNSPRRALEHAVETINVRANGEQFPVEIHGGKYELDDHELFLIVLRDISERKQTERNLQEKEHLLSEAQRTGHMGSWSYDLANDVLQFSDEMYRSAGHLHRRNGRPPKMVY